MSKYTVIPAYGVDYKTAKAAKQDWIDGKDFKIATHVRDPNDGKYCSIRDGFEVTIRFNKQQYTTKGVSK